MTCIPLSKFHFFCITTFIWNCCESFRLMTSHNRTIFILMRKGFLELEYKHFFADKILTKYSKPKFLWFNVEIQIQKRTFRKWLSLYSTKFYIRTQNVVIKPSNRIKMCWANTKVKIGLFEWMNPGTVKWCIHRKRNKRWCIMCLCCAAQCM